jgi:predicted nucleic acid-binding protein
MKFWDASAVVPLVIEEANTGVVTGWLRDDPEMLLWGLTRVEIVSAVERRAREGLLSLQTRSAALRRIDRIANAAHEITDLLAVRTRSIALLGRHDLRAADAAQLGAALVVADPAPGSLTIAVLDRRLARAAAREGFDVLTG